MNKPRADQSKSQLFSSPGVIAVGIWVLGSACGWGMTPGQGRWTHINLQVLQLQTDVVQINDIHVNLHVSVYLIRQLEIFFCILYLTEPTLCFQLKLKS